MEAPMNPNMNAGGSAPRSSRVGSIIVTLVLLAVIVAAGVYFWRAHEAKPAPDAASQANGSVEGAASVETGANAVPQTPPSYNLDESNFTSS